MKDVKQPETVNQRVWFEGCPHGSTSQGLVGDVQSLRLALGQALLHPGFCSASLEMPMVHRVQGVAPPPSGRGETLAPSWAQSQGA